MNNMNPNSIDDLYDSYVNHGGDLTLDRLTKLVDKAISENPELYHKNSLDHHLSGLINALLFNLKYTLNEKLAIAEFGEFLIKEDFSKEDKLEKLKTMYDEKLNWVTHPLQTKALEENYISAILLIKGIES